jgi:imidazolonepropionase-like amidohydrolase
MLLRGFTTVRDTGGADAALRNAIEEGLLPGPRLFIAGKALSQTGGHGDSRAPYQDSDLQCCGGHQPSLSRICDGVPDCLAAARDELRKGADFLKIMCGGGVASPADPLDMLQFTSEEIQAITRTAAQRSTYVTAHTYTSEAIRHAVDNGVLGIEHGNFVDAETAAYCAAKGVFVTPTLITYKAMSSAPFDAFLDEAGRAKNRAVLASGVQALRICAEAGVTLCFGSDLLSGMHALQNGEFALRAEALSAVEIVRSATVNAARLLRMEGRLGVVKKDAIADLLILDENPLEDVTVLDRMSTTLLSVIKDGRVVASKIPELHVDPLYDTMKL